MRKTIRAVLGLTAIAAGAAVAADPPAGYLDGAPVDLIHILPSPPQKGEIRYEADRAIFKAMKSRIGSDRWNYAKADVPSSAADVMRDFSCAAGIALSPDRQPAIYRVLANAGVDTARENNRAKDSFKRLRPFLIDKGQVCEADPDEVAKSYDYPSGHTTRGWTTGLILAELLPARANEILIRARAYGESRMVCRVHNASAVEAGRIGATATMEAVRAKAAFQTDLVAAKAELAMAQPAPDAAACGRERAVLWPSALAGVKAKK